LIDNKAIASEMKGKNSHIIICKAKPSDMFISNILKQEEFAYIRCENESEIYKSLEVLFFKISGGRYRMD